MCCGIQRQFVWESSKNFKGAAQQFLADVISDNNLPLPFLTSQGLRERKNEEFAGGVMYRQMQHNDSILLHEAGSLHRKKPTDIINTVAE